ncbi:MAG: Sigma-70, region 4 [Candidatus Atribacteria bacterium]|nr:Sigma-70, region 4 [Candidatus Atribacteria bacterium]
MKEKELFHHWNKILKEEGLAVYRGGKELPLLEAEEKITYSPPSPRADIKLPLELLSPRQREVIYLLFYDCLSEQETANRLGISRPSVRVHRNRALARLKKALEKEEKFKKFFAR